MAQVIQLHVWLKDSRERWLEKEVLVMKTDPKDGHKKMLPHVGKRIVLEVEGVSIARMKTMVAETVEKWIGKKLKNYYVVAVVQRDDGSIGYKTIVRMTPV
jgi:hypothetical protein